MNQFKLKMQNFIKLGGSTFALQGLIQLIGMLIGFYIVRQLSIEEYAYYTVANTVIAMMTVLSDSGVSTSVYAQGGKVWTDRKSLGAIVNTGIKFRKYFSIIALIISIPILCYLLFLQKASFLTVFLICLATLPLFISNLTTSIYEIVPKLHQDLKELQLNQILVAVVRLILTGILLVIFPFTWVAVLAAGLPRGLGNIKLKKLVNKNADLSQPISESAQKETIRIVKRTMPGAFYFAFSGQISLFILSYMGNIQNTASWGALGRFSVLFTVVSMVIGLILIPKYARLENDKKKLIIMSHKILLITFIFGFFILIFTFLFSSEILMILGNNYKNLNNELLLIMLNGFIILLTGNAISFSIRRGWIVNPIFDLSINIIPLIFFGWLIEFKSLSSILVFGILCSLTSFICHYIVFWYQLLRNFSDNEKN